MFRIEAIQEKRERLYGETLIAVPIAWQTIGYLLFGALVLGLGFLSFAQYARIETATGTIVPDKGVSSIVPTRPGILSELAVAEGTRIEAGDLLAQIRTEEDSGQSLSSAEQIERAIGRQDASIASQISAARAAASAQQSQLATKRSGLRYEIGQIRSQITLQNDLIESAKADLDLALEVAKGGFISGRDLRRREETLLSRQQGLSQLEQSLAAKEAALIETENASAQIAAQAREQAAVLAAARAAVGQQAASTAGARSYAIRAPVAGTVTALTARVGQRADPQTPLMVIVPTGARLQAELAVPSAAIGFVKKGQEVRLAIDAFPYQRFGTVKGEVLTVAASAVKRRTPTGGMMPVYPVTARLEAEEVRAFGRSERLVSGMTVSARIVTERQTLIEWLFEPLFAVK